MNVDPPGQLGSHDEKSSKEPCRLSIDRNASCRADRSSDLDSRISDELQDNELDGNTNVLTISRTTVEVHPVSMFLESGAEAWWFVIIGALATCVSSITIPIYFPALNVLADYFQTSVEKINFTATIYSIFQGISPLVWATLSDQFGRRPIFIACVTINLAANIGLAFCTSYSTLFGLRILQAAGGASTVSLAYGLIGDITQRKTRGGLVGWLGGLGLLGNCFGPIIGGALMTRWGWRSLFWFLVILAGVTLLLILVALPETSRPIVGRGTITPSRLINRSPYTYVRRWLTGLPYARDDERAKNEWIADHHKIQYFRWFYLLRQPDVLLLLTPMSLMYTVWYMVLTAQSTLLAAKYNLPTQSIGFTYLSSGIGTIGASLLAGRSMQYLYHTRFKSWVEKRHESPGSAGQKFDIYRARMAWSFYAMTMMICTTIIFAWTIDKQVSFYVPVVMTFFVSAASTYLQATTNALLIDLFPGDSATAVGCSNLTRCLLCAAGLSAVERMVDKIGAGASFSIMSGLILISSICLITLFFKGMSLQASRERSENKSISFSSGKSTDSMQIQKQ